MEAVPKVKTKNKHKKASRARVTDGEDAGLLSPDELPKVSVRVESEVKRGSRYEESLSQPEEREHLLASPARSARSDDEHLETQGALASLVASIHIESAASVSGPLDSSAPQLDEFPVIDDPQLFLPRFNENDQNGEQLTEENSDFEQLSELCREERVSPFTDTQLLSVYRNEELEMVSGYMEQFLEEELRGSCNITSHPLHILLVAYMRAREQRSINKQEVESLLSDCDDTQARLWTLETASITEGAECQDGNPVEATHEYQIGRFDRPLLSNLANKLATLRKLVNDEHSLITYSCEVLYIQIEDLLQKLVSSFAYLPHNAPVSLNCQGVPYKTGELRAAAAVLFSFQRQPLRDKEFLSQTRRWLSNLLSVLLRLANWQAHLFILNHLLRCPRGVRKWAAGLVQLPQPPQNSSHAGAYLNHMIATLSVLVSPIQHRDVFLSQLSKCNDEGDDPWIVVDSDGEDESDPTQLDENDVIAFLNQIPVESLFRQMLQLSGKEDGSQPVLGSSQMMRVLAVAKALVSVTAAGLKHYVLAPQISKTLANLLNHTVHYATDSWLSFLQENNESHDKILLERLQVEYDDLMLVSCKHLLSTPNKTVLQFLAGLPFKAISLPVLWKIYNMTFQPHQTDMKDICPSGGQWWAGVEELVPSLSDDELYYILSSASNMALERYQHDWLFIKVVTVHMLQIGYLNQTTRSKCYKIARTLLSNLVFKNPDLISVLLDRLKTTVSRVGNLSIYLFKDLPLDLWIPTDEDLCILEYWLLSYSVGSSESSLAQYILSNLQWGLNPDVGGELFLKRETHCRVALLLMKVAITHCPETTNTTSASVLAETLKQVTSSVGGKSLSSRQSLSVWVWEMLFRVRLHLLDQPDPSVWATLTHPAQHFSSLPSLDSPTSDLMDLSEGIAEKQVTSVFLAVALTSDGHSLPLICSRGFSHLLSLVQAHRYIACLHLIQHIIPLFLDCPQSLLSSEVFGKVLGGLATADKTFLRSAKNMIISSYPGLVIKYFGDMIQTMLDNYRKYNQSSPASIANIWLQLLTKVWYLEPQSVTYLLDVVLRVAFFIPELKSSASEIFYELYQSVTTVTKSKFPLSWMGGGSGIPSTLVSRSAPDTPWFAFYALEVEQLCTQVSNGLWKQLLSELATPKGKVNIDSSLKKVCSMLKQPLMPSASLSVFRWSQQALDTPVDHPLLPIIWQKFFSLYLDRVPTSPGSPEIGGVGGKFFEGMTNLMYLKKIKKKLKDCKEFHEAKCVNTTQVISDEKKKWLHNISQLYVTMALWLEEPRLQEPELYLPSLPAQYDSVKLCKIFNNDPTLWYEYIDYESVMKMQKECVTNWLKCVFRQQTTNMRLNNMQSELDPSSRTSKRLQCYARPVSAPSVHSFQPVLPPLPKEAFHDQLLLLDLLKPSVKALTSYAQRSCIGRAEHISLDCALLETLPLLYRSEELEVKLYAACDTHNPHVPRPSPDALNCAGPATIRLKVSEIRLNASTEVAIKNNRMEMYTGVKRMMQPPPSQYILSSAYIESVVKELEREWGELKCIGDAELLGFLQEVGVGVFYSLTNVFTEKVSSYTPFKKLVTSCVDTLGQCFVSGCERQAPVVLESLLSMPSLAPLLASHFAPSQASPPVYLTLYQLLLSPPAHISQDLVFVLLTKFEMEHWLLSKRPRAQDRSQLIDFVLQALAKNGQNPPEDWAMIHEVLRRQLCVLTGWDAPQHYIEAVSGALKYSEDHQLASDIWYDIVNTMASPTGASFRPHMPLALLIQQTAKFATQQTHISYQELLELCEVVAEHYKSERLQYGLYGLYPKYRDYVSPTATLLTILGHLAVVSAVHKHSPSAPLKVCEEVWGLLVKLYSPWLGPYYTQSLTQPTAAWIQQLTDDRSVLLPWINSDSGFAHKIAAVFTETIRFILDTLPGSGEIFSCVWQFYVTHYAHHSVKEHILNVIHGNFLSLPWNKFYPTFYDLDLMLKVCDTYVPQCHSVLGVVFIEVPWVEWMSRLPQGDITLSARVHTCLLHLLIKLTHEPSVRQSGKIIGLLEESYSFHWDCVDSNNYESVMNWFVMSYDPRLILKLDDDNYDIDLAALQLLKISAGYCPMLTSCAPTTPRKRQIFVRACTKLIISSVSKYKALLNTHKNKIETALEDLLTQIELVVPKGSVGEGSVLMSEILPLLNMSEGHPLPPMLTNAVRRWLSSRGPTLVAATLLRTAPTTLTDPNTLGAITEAALHSLFSEVGGGGVEWRWVVGCLGETLTRHPCLDQALLGSSHLLSLYAFTLTRLTPQPSVVNMLRLTLVLTLLGAVLAQDGADDKCGILINGYLDAALTNLNNLLNKMNVHEVPLGDISEDDVVLKGTRLSDLATFVRTEDSYLVISSETTTETIGGIGLAGAVITIDQLQVRGQSYGPASILMEGTSVSFQLTTEIFDGGCKERFTVIFVNNVTVATLQLKNSPNETYDLADKINEYLIPYLNEFLSSDKVLDAISKKADACNVSNGSELMAKKVSAIKYIFNTK